MGPNGSGKSTLAYVIAGDPRYEVTEGSIRYQGEDILEWSPDERARKGLFLAFQYPTVIPGVSMANFLRMAVTNVRNARAEDAAAEGGSAQPITPREFRRLMREKMALLKMDDAFATRYLNEGFSGGEKKRAEILQMALLEPKMAVLDETDSGLDIDALKVVSEGVNNLAGPEVGHAADHPLPALAELHQARFRPHHDWTAASSKAAVRSSPTSSKPRATRDCAPALPRRALASGDRASTSDRRRNQTMVAKPQVDIGEYQYGFRDEEDYVFKSERGLTRDTVEEISAMKDEPDWMRDFRLKALEHFQKRPMPNWGARSLRDRLRRHLLLHPARREAGQDLGRGPGVHQEHLREARHPRGGAEVPGRRRRAVRESRSSTTRCARTSRSRA